MQIILEIIGAFFVEVVVGKLIYGFGKLILNIYLFLGKGFNYIWKKIKKNENFD